MNLTAPAVVTLGESLALFGQSQAGVLRSGTPFEFRIGGAESNVAIGLARLGVPVCWIGRLGQDPYGDEVIRAMRGEGVEVLARRDAHRPTGLMMKDRRTAAHQRITYYRADSAGSALNVTDLDQAAIEAAQILHITGISLAISESAATAVKHAVQVAQDADTLVSFDVNYRSKLWTAETAQAAIVELLPKVDLLFAGIDEAGMIVGDAADQTQLARRLQAMGPTQVVLKRGERGAFGADGNDAASVAASAVPVVDTVGAGDAFVAGYLTAQLREKSLTERLQMGCATGAFACTSAGDWEGAASDADLRLLLGSDSVTR